MNKMLRVARGGFSMVEVALALGIVGFSMLAIMGLFPLAMNTARDSLTETRATQLAQDTFSDLVGQRAIRNGTTWNSNIFLNPGSTSVTLVYDSEGATTSNPARSFYNQRVTITRLSSGAGSTNWQAQIYTAWPSLTNPLGSNQFVRVISQP
jgi:uncharacterized protein (TIGR02598 family)